MDVSQNPINILGITVDQFNNLWLATRYHGVLKHDGGTGQWKAYDNNNSPLTDN